MPRRIDWESQIGRRLRFRDLHVFFTVLDLGSMAQAAARLGVTAPTVSEVIGDLENTLGVRLLDRTSKGVVSTPYGQALAMRGRAAFDELRQGIRDIESIADPATSEVRIGCPESLAAFLVLVIERAAQPYPRMRFQVQPVSWPTVAFPELHERKIDLVLGPSRPHPPDGASEMICVSKCCLTIHSRSSLVRAADGHASAKPNSLIW